MIKKELFYFEDPLKKDKSISEFNESRNELINALFLVRQYKKRIKELLTWIKVQFDLDAFLETYLQSDYLCRLGDRLECYIIFDNRTCKVTVISKFDSNIKASTKLLRDEKWLEWRNKQYLKERAKDELKKLKKENLDV